MLIGISPVRISFAGGGTDLPEYYEKFGGNVVTSSISKFTYVIIQNRNDDSFQAFSPDFGSHHKPSKFDKIEHITGTEIATSAIKYFKYDKGVNMIIFSDVPGGSGLGASSSLMVNAVNMLSTLTKKNFTNEKIAETAFHISRNFLNWPVGKQDEYVSSFGGFNFIEFNKEKTKVTPIKMKKKSITELQNNLLLFFIGHTRDSSKILTNQINRIKKMNPTTIDSLHNVQNLAKDMKKSLQKSDLTQFGELLHNGWNMKKKFTKNVTTDYIDKLYDIGMKNGALGGKLTGAGGGGHMLFYCESPKQKKLIKEMSKLGIKKIDFKFHSDGAKILNLNNYS
jgi:D-glycero-alpha-D-manno-heptose-7-phosphate kinase